MPVRGGLWAVKGEPGVAFRYVGQATYVDDEGREVEHDHVRMAPVGGGPEVWVAPADVSAFLPAVAGVA